MKLHFRLLTLPALVLLTGSALSQNATNFQVVGQNPLFNRGMNAAAAIFQNFIYIGNRTDGSSRCGIGDPRRTDVNFGLNSCPHPHPGILILNIQNPAMPTIVGEIPAPLNTSNLPKGITSRELRVWPNKKLLITMNFRCSSLIHACVGSTDTTSPFDLKFFNLSDPTNPKFISHYVPTSHAGLPVKPHEMFLWVDPNNGDRALLFISTPPANLDVDRTIPQLMVVDISNVPTGGSVTELAEANWSDLYPGTSQPNYPFDASSPDGCGPYDCNLFVHSMGVKPDGSITYMALEAGHFLVLNTGDVAANRIPAGTVLDLHDKLLTNPTNRPVWLQNPADPTAVPNEFPNDCARTVSSGTLPRDCPNSHSAVQVPSRQLALTTDEVYGTFPFPGFGLPGDLLFPGFGCRWGWMRLIDVSQPANPFITGEYLIDQDQLSFCGSAADTAITEEFRSLSSHNPTVLQNLAFIDWHSGGVQAIDISDETNPVQAGVFQPTPISVVANEDPALTRGPATTVDQLLQPSNTDLANPDFKTKFALWSYPIIKNGLIYVIDIRNGLFILRYTGPHSDEVQQINFLEGNSNLGDAVDIDQNQK
jgi:hypothetical protein